MTPCVLRATAIIGACVLVALLVVATITWASSGRRADDARARLADAAEQLQSCRAARGTYDGCQTGEELVSERVAWDGVDGYRLSVDVFGVGTFRVIGRGATSRRFTCDAHGSRCSDGRWSPPTR
ncbi:MAG: hypothetical protein JWM86_1099 [Thermoleophilia bacterium]|nr:hypothetical protein [Thermoleophilia bacterium]